VQQDGALYKMASRDSSCMGSPLPTQLVHPHTQSLLSGAPHFLVKSRRSGVVFTAHVQSVPSQEVTFSTRLICSMMHNENKPGESLMVTMF